jgi:integrase
MKEREDQQTPEQDGNPLWQKTQYANIVRYVPSGTFFARFKVKGKLIWRSLKTDKITVARLRLADMQDEELKKAEAGKQLAKGKVTVGDAIALYRARGFRPVVPRTKKDAKRLKPAAVAYYEQRVKALLESWPDMEKRDARSVTKDEVKRWADRMRQNNAATVFNHTLGMLRQIFAEAVEAGARYDNPVDGIMRESETSKKLTLPTPDQFQRFIAEIENSGSGHSRPCADLVRFLAFTGCRKGEAAHVTFADCSLIGGTITLRGHPETGLKNRTPGEIRVIPMIPECRALIERLKDDAPDAGPDERVMRVQECQKSMDRAAKAVGMPRITHHDLRHLFATQAIENGVDIPTVARWMGHKDGGALAMRVYGHLRDKHSQAMAATVSFTPKPAGDIIPMPNQKGGHQ